jgi:hypothetical protein
MKALLVLVISSLVFSAQALAQSKPAQSRPCVIVSANQQVKFVTAFGAVRAERFIYIDSMNLSVSQIKSEYKRKA